MRLAEDLGAECIRIKADDVATGLARVAHEKNVESIVIGHSRRGRLQELLQGSTVNKLLRLVRDVDVHVITEREPHNDGR